MAEADKVTADLVRWPPNRPRFSAGKFEIMDRIARTLIRRRWVIGMIKPPSYGQLAQIYDVPHLVTDVGLYLDSRELS